MLTPATNIKEKIEDMQHTLLARNILAQTQFKKIISLLNEITTAIIPLKGIFLQNFVYGISGVRDMSDVDILVKPNDAKKIYQLLIQNGYRPHPANIPATKIGKIGYLNSIFFHDKDTNSYLPPVHLHWHLINASIPAYLALKNINLEEIWDASSEEKIDGLQFRRMKNEHTLAHLCEHLAKHSYSCPMHFFDIIAVVKKCQIDPLCFSRICYKWKIEKIAYLALHFTYLLAPEKQLLSLLASLGKIPETIETRIIKRYVKSGHLWHGLGSLTYLSQIQQIGEKLLFLVKTIFPDKEELIHFGKSPSPRSFLRRFTGLLKLLCKII